MCVPLAGRLALCSVAHAAQDPRVAEGCHARLTLIEMMILGIDKTRH